jgi:DHA1 family bicyclomycin/chloramphenicol resistance-like MFS transporter
MNSRTLHPDSAGLLVLLAALVALGPLTIDMYLPAMPGMAQALTATTSEVQLTISSYLLGFSLFHLVCGPLADRYGRKPVLLGGLALYLVATYACAQATSIDELILFRFLQGVAACVGPTLGRAIARDLYGPQRAARALAHIAMIMALAPAVAPTLGGLMLEFYSWPSIFTALALYALLVMLFVGARLPESLPQVQPLHPAQVGRNYLRLVRDRHFMATTCASALIYAGMIAFLSASSFIFIDMMQVPARYFGILFLTTVVGYIAGSGFSTRLSRTRESEQVMWVGARLALAASVLMLIATQSWFHPVSILLPMTCYSMALGIVLPHAMAVALRPFPDMAATASALFGFIQMGLSAIGGALVGFYLVDSALPMLVVIVCLSTLSWWLIRRLQGV